MKGEKPSNTVNLVNLLRYRRNKIEQVLTIELSPLELEEAGLELSHNLLIEEYSKSVIRTEERFNNNDDDDTPWLMVSQIQASTTPPASSLMRSTLTVSTENLLALGVSGRMSVEPKASGT